MENGNERENPVQRDESKNLLQILQKWGLILLGVGVVAGLLVALGFAAAQPFAVKDDRSATPVVRTGCKLLNFGDSDPGYRDNRPAIVTTCGTYAIFNNDDLHLFHVGETYSLSMTPGNWAESPVLLGVAK